MTTQKLILIHLHNKNVLKTSVMLKIGINYLPYLITVSLLKLVEIRPGITQVWLYLDRTIKPLPGLGYLSFCPKYVSEKVMGFTTY